MLDNCVKLPDKASLFEINFKYSNVFTPVLLFLAFGEGLLNSLTPIIEIDNLKFTGTSIEDEHTLFILDK